MHRTLKTQLTHKRGKPVERPQGKLALGCKMKSILSCSRLSSLVVHFSRVLCRRLVSPTLKVSSKIYIFSVAMFRTSFTSVAFVRKQEVKTWDINEISKIYPNKSIWNNQRDWPYIPERGREIICLRTTHFS